MKHLFCSLLLLVGLILSMTAVYAQSITNLPPNSKHPDDYEIFPRPRLSMIGFNSPNVNYGYGLKQILEQAPTASLGTPIRDVYDQVVSFSLL